MKITRLQVYILRAPDTGRPHWVSNFIVPRANEILVRMETDEGLEGIGIATSYTPIEAAVAAFRSGIADLVVGMDPLAPEQVYQKLFALTWSRLASEKKWSREAVIRISSAVDIACWDLVGKVAKLPLYRLFGGYRNEVPCYVTCAYYRDGKTMSELRDEMQMLKAQGHRGFKAKAGGAPLEATLTVVSPAARIVHVGQSAGATATIASGLVRGKALRILGYTNFAVPQEVLAEGYATLVGHAVAGQIRVETETLSLDAVAEAWSRQTAGPQAKLVLVP